MNTDFRKKAIVAAIIALALAAAALLTFFVFWPVFAFNSDAAWVGQIFWVILLATIVFVAVRAAIRVEDAALVGIDESGTVDCELDKGVFEDKVRSCFNDQSITGYFKRNLVRDDDVAEALVEGAAFSQACRKRTYGIYASSRFMLQKVGGSSYATLHGSFNSSTAPVLLSSPILIILLFTQVSFSTFLTSGLTFLSAILAAASAWTFAAVRDERHQSKDSQHLRKLTIAGICFCASFCAIILPPVVFGVMWLSVIAIFPVGLFSLATFYNLGRGQTLRQCTDLLAVGALQMHLVWLRYESVRNERAWLEDCEEAIKEQANLQINTILGKDKDLLLVEQDSEGLRRLQDQSYTVFTRSEHRIASVLSQMDAGSIALAGPRAGKSTLLRKFSGQQHSKHEDPGIHLYLPAPAEYIPRDFIAAFLQQLCESYLNYVGWALPGPIYRESQDYKSRVSLRGFFSFLSLLTRTAILIAAIMWIIRSFTGTHYNHIYETALAASRHWFSNVYQSVYQKGIYKHLRPYWSWLRVVLLVFAALFLLSITPRWVGYFKRYAEPELVSKARDYLRRLQIEKTITWGKGTILGSPARGASFSLSRGGSASYTPWTLPELVTHTRRFMQDISDQLSNLSHAIVVGIDEIDRIGSLDHAEKFIGEIKAIFGVEKCFFLVAVAEDVGSIFSQRATAGRSILENAFDDIVVVEPLDLMEARDLLLRRVPGFTDSFVYLVHALSGGLPRELIRITRRLVDVNQEAGTGSIPLRLENLAFCLVREELIEAIRATRNQLARLSLHTNWTAFFEKVHSVSLGLRYVSPLSVHQSYDFVKQLSELVAPNAPGDVPTMRDLALKDEEEAKRIVRDFTAFSYFGLIIIDAFSDRYFYFDRVRLRATNKSNGSYEELAVARVELAVSPENSRAMLLRFRNSLPSP